MTSYAFVLALKVHMAGQDYAEFESYGTVDLSSGSSRHDVFKQIRSNMIDSARKQGIHGGVTTVFWSLEPDTLGEVR